jgi:hypothetical protein
VRGVTSQLLASLKLLTPRDYDRQLLSSSERLSGVPECPSGEWHLSELVGTLRVEPVEFETAAN